MIKYFTFILCLICSCASIKEEVKYPIVANEMEVYMPSRISFKVSKFDYDYVKVKYKYIDYESSDGVFFITLKENNIYNVEYIDVLYFKKNKLVNQSKIKLISKGYPPVKLLVTQFTGRDTTFLDSLVPPIGIWGAFYDEGLQVCKVSKFSCLIIRGNQVVYDSLNIGANFNETIYKSLQKNDVLLIKDIHYKCFTLNPDSKERIGGPLIFYIK